MKIGIDARAALLKEKGGFGVYALSAAALGPAAL